MTYSTVHNPHAHNHASLAFSAAAATTRSGVLNACRTRHRRPDRGRARQLQGDCATQLSACRPAGLPACLAACRSACCPPGPCSTTISSCPRPPRHSRTPQPQHSPSPVAGHCPIAQCHSSHNHDASVAAAAASGLRERSAAQGRLTLPCRRPWSRRSNLRRACDARELALGSKERVKSVQPRSWPLSDREASGETLPA